MPTNAVAIDADWITNAGSAPYILNAPNTVYTLGVDVNVVDSGFKGQPFKLVGNEIVLNLNGHSVRVAGKPVPQITDSMVYRRSSENTVRADNSKDSYMFGGKQAVGVGKAGKTVDIIPDSDRPLINGYARTK